MISWRSQPPADGMSLPLTSHCWLCACGSRHQRRSGGFLAEAEQERSVFYQTGARSSLMSVGRKCCPSRDHAMRMTGKEGEGLGPAQTDVDVALAAPGVLVDPGRVGGHIQARNPHLPANLS